MSDFLLNLFTDYGAAALAWVLSVVGVFAIRWLKQKSQWQYLDGAIGRAWSEIRAAVLEVGQTYADSLKRSQPDGWTDAEKREARNRAIAIAKSNLGKDGLAALARILGAENVESWLANKIEATVRAVKVPASTGHKLIAAAVSDSGDPRPA